MNEYGGTGPITQMESQLPIMINIISDITISAIYEKLYILSCIFLRMAILRSYIKYSYHYAFLFVPQQPLQQGLPQALLKYLSEHL